MQPAAPEQVLKKPNWHLIIFGMLPVITKPYLSGNWLASQTSVFTEAHACPPFEIVLNIRFLR